MNEKSTIQYRQKIGPLEFLVKFVPFVARVPFIAYHAIKGLGMISGKKNMSWGLMLETIAAQYPERMAIKSHDGMLTYRELNESANRFAHFLKSKKVARGDAVTVCIDTRPELLVLYCGCSKIGAVCSMININQRGDSLVHSFNLNKGSVIVVGEECYGFFKEVEDSVDTKGSFLCYVKDPAIGRLQEKNELNALLRDMPANNLPETKELTVRDRIAYVYTSGTTGGLPKAAVIINKRALSAMFWWGRVVTPVQSRHTIYVPLPFFHTNALTVGWPPALYSGAAVAIRRKFSASGFVDDVKKFQATHFIYIGEVCRYLMAQPGVPGQDRTTLKYIIGNGLRPDIWKSFKKRYGIRKVYEFYGAAEGVGVLTNIMNFDYCVGMSLTPYAIVKYDVENNSIVRDKDGMAVKAKKGEPGLCIMEISEKTPFSGYSDKKKTEEKILRDVFRKGDAWFNTGDMLRNMGYGQAQFVDRLGDTFRWKGENVATGEVEKALDSFKGVESSAVYGVAMPAGDGKAGMAAVIADGGSLDFSALAEHLRSALPKYAVPLFIRLVRDFEWTPTHKIKKTALKSDGYDRKKVSGGLYVLLPGTDTYVPVDDAMYKEIISGAYKF
ncbi:MAG: long-chain-acyl-CoA synthetase [Spirochaetes bacterium]|nr:long-chain-acyl-CoA synthetase [Spirochaetota bacterium]